MSTESNEQDRLAQWRVVVRYGPHGSISSVGYDTRAAAESAIQFHVRVSKPDAMGLYRLEAEHVLTSNYVERVPHPDAP